MIHVSDLVHKYKEYSPDGNHVELKTALNGVDLDIREGEFAAILGANGSGKSTLARHLNGLLQPDEGVVQIDGRSTSAEEGLWKIRDCVGMVFQNPDNQIIGTTVEEDCAFGLEMRAVEPKEIRKRVDEELKTVGLADRRKLSPARLSGGQKQREAIAGVAVCRPRCIVLDEPTAMLDPHARRRVVQLLHQLNREAGITIVLITHYMDEAVGADRIFIMEDGKIVLSGTPQVVFSDLNRLRELRLDVPQVTAAADALCRQGIPFSCPVLTIRQFTEEFMKIYREENGIAEK